MDVQSLCGAPTHSLRKTIGTVTIVGLFFLSTCTAAQQEVATNGDNLQAGQWVKDLASPWPVERERAYCRLKKAGLTAFDSLLLHRNSEDPQVQASLEQLLLELESTWLGEIRSAEVRLILVDFHQKIPEDQFSRIQQLAAINSEDAIRTLGLVCRYELDETLGRLAATYLLQNLRRNDDVNKNRQRKIMLETTRSSLRPTCRWLQIGLDPDSFSESAVAELLSCEQDRMKNGDHLARQTSRHLLICLAGLSRESDRNSPKSRLSNLLIDVIVRENRPSELIELADVLIHWQAWEKLKRLAANQPDSPSPTPVFLLRMAHAAWIEGDLQSGNKLFESAISMIAGYPSSLVELGATMQAQHYDLLAESIWRRAVSSAEDITIAAIRARLLLAELLASHQRYDNAAELVQQTIDALQRTPDSTQKSLKTLQVTMEFLAARESYFRAEAFRASGDTSNQCIYLIRGLQSDPDSSELLIAALKASTSTSRLRGIVLELVDLRCTTLQLEIDHLQAQNLVTPKAVERYPREQKLARQCNRLAWLMAGTQRSPHQAVLFARQAVAVDPNNAHYVDTLARCLFVAGDAAKAVAFARQSLQLDPGNPDFRDNVRQYENARLQSYIAGRSEPNSELK